MVDTNRKHLLGALIGIMLVPALTAQSWSFPDRPVRVIVPYAPGGGNDALARVLGQKLEEQWGKPVVIENKSGGNTIIATEFTAKQPADGYTILMVSTVFAVNPSMVQKLPYDTLANFTPVVLAGTAPNVLVTKPSLPVNSVKELIAYAHANPGKLTYGFPGAGTTPHLAGSFSTTMPTSKRSASSFAAPNRSFWRCCLATSITCSMSPAPSNW